MRENTKGQRQETGGGSGQKIRADDVDYGKQTGRPNKLWPLLRQHCLRAAQRTEGIVLMKRETKELSISEPFVAP